VSAYRGIKQLEGDRSTTTSPATQGRVVDGKVKSLDAKGAVISLDGDVEGYLRASRCRVTAWRTSAST
jgi:small subunit ribosomal protein S1